jgi:CyaY protein
MSTAPPATAERRRLPAPDPRRAGRIEATTDRWLQQDVIDIDTQRTGGLLELSFPDGSKIILNTQPPLQEVWLAARGGGYHYRWVAGQWLDTRDGSEFLAAALSEHASRKQARR